MSVNALSTKTNTATELNATKLRQTTQRQTAQQDVSTLEQLVEEEQLEGLRMDAEQAMRSMVAGPKGLNTLSKALTGKPMSQMSAAQQDGLRRLASDIKNGSVAPKFTFADSGTSGAKLQKPVSGAFVAGRNGKPGTVYLSRDLSKPESKAAAREEIGEAVSRRAQNLGIDVAGGDAGARVLSAMEGRDVSRDTMPDAFKAKASDDTIVTINGQNVAAKARLGNFETTLTEFEPSKAEQEAARAKKLAKADTSKDANGETAADKKNRAREKQIAISKWRAGHESIPAHITGREERAIYSAERAKQREQINHDYGFEGYKAMKAKEAQAAAAKPEAAAKPDTTDVTMVYAKVTIPASADTQSDHIVVEQFDAKREKWVIVADRKGGGPQNTAYAELHTNGAPQLRTRNLTQDTLLTLADEQSVTKSGDTTTFMTPSKTGAATAVAVTVTSAKPTGKDVDLDVITEAKEANFTFRRDGSSTATDIASIKLKDFQGKTFKDFQMQDDEGKWHVIAKFDPKGSAWLDQNGKRDRDGIIIVARYDAKGGQPKMRFNTEKGIVNVKGKAEDTKKDNNDSWEGKPDDWNVEMDLPNTFTMSNITNLWFRSEKMPTKLLHIANAADLKEAPVQSATPNETILTPTDRQVEGSGAAGWLSISNLESALAVALARALYSGVNANHRLHEIQHIDSTFVGHQPHDYSTEYPADSQVAKARQHAQNTAKLSPPERASAIESRDLLEGAQLLANMPPAASAEGLLAMDPQDGARYLSEVTRTLPIKAARIIGEMRNIDPDKAQKQLEKLDDDALDELILIIDDFHPNAAPVGAQVPPDGRPTTVTAINPMTGQRQPVSLAGQRREGNGSVADVTTLDGLPATGLLATKPDGAHTWTLQPKMKAAGNDMPPDKLQAWLDSMLIPPSAATSPRPAGSAHRPPPPPPPPPPNPLQL